MYYKVTIGGREYQFIKLSYKRQASLEPQPFDISLVIPTGATMPVIGESVSIIRVMDTFTGITSITRYQGTIEGVKEIISDQSIVRVFGRDFKNKTQYLNVINLSYSGQKGSNIVNTEMFTNTGLTFATVNTTDPVLDSMDFGKGVNSAFNRRSALEFVQMVSDFELLVRPAGSTDYKSQCGTDRSTTVIMEHGKNVILDPDIGYTKDESGKVKKVHVKGKGTGTINTIDGFAQDVGYVAGDKQRVVELPFIGTSDIANKAATAILNELNRTIEYAVVDVTDVFTAGFLWDVFDTVKLKARLKSGAIDTNLRVYSIDVNVSPSSERYETIKVELLNFRRAIWASLVIPSEVGNAEDRRIGLAISSTQLQDQIGKAGGASVVTTAINAAVVDNLVTGTTTNIFSQTFPATPKTMGMHCLVDVEIIPRKVSGVDFPRVNMLLNDGTVDYPSATGHDIYYDNIIGRPTTHTLHIFIPTDVAGKTVTLKGTCIGIGADVDIFISASWYSIEAHNH